MSDLQPHNEHTDWRLNVIHYDQDSTSGPHSTLNVIPRGSPPPELSNKQKAAKARKAENDRRSKRRRREQAAAEASMHVQRRVEVPPLVTTFRATPSSSITGSVSNFTHAPDYSHPGHSLVPAPYPLYPPFTQQPVIGVPSHVPSPHTVPYAGVPAMYPATHYAPAYTSVCTLAPTPTYTFPQYTPTALPPHSWFFPHFTPPAAVYPPHAYSTYAAPAPNYHSSTSGSPSPHTSVAPVNFPDGALYKYTTEDSSQNHSDHVSSFEFPNDAVPAAQSPPDNLLEKHAVQTTHRRSREPPQVALPDVELPPPAKASHSPLPGPDAVHSSALEGTTAHGRASLPVVDVITLEHGRSPSLAPLTPPPTRMNLSTDPDFRLPNAHPASARATDHTTPTHPPPPELADHTPIASLSGPIAKPSRFTPEAELPSSLNTDNAAGADPSGAKDYFALVSGHELSHHAPLVVWPDGTTTVAPFIPVSPQEPTANAIPDDAAAVQRQARNPCSTECPFVLNIDHSGLSRLQVKEKSGEALGLGHTIVLRAYEKPEDEEFEDYLKLRGVDQTAPVHPINGELFTDAALRHAQLEQPVDGPFGPFVDAVTDHNTIQWILALRFSRHDTPALVQDLDEGKRYGYDNHVQQRRFLYESQEIHDIESLWEWALAHHAGVYTAIHHDSDGLLTYFIVKTGAKLWTLVRPRGYSAAKFEEELDELLKQLTDHANVDAGLNHFKRRYEELGGEAFTIHAQSGDLIIMAPGTYHLVYTPVKTVTVGGHGLTYRTLHLTEVSRHVDAEHGLILTNAEHSGVPLVLAGMMLSVFMQAPRCIVLHTKPLQALCRMVIKPDAYIAASSNGDAHDRVMKIVRTHMMCRIAKLLATHLVEHMGWEVHKRDFIFAGDSWMNPGPEIDYDLLADLRQDFQDTEVMEPGSGTKFATMLRSNWKRPSQRQKKALKK